MGGLSEKDAKKNTCRTESETGVALFAQQLEGSSNRKPESLNKGQVALELGFRLLIVYKSHYPTHQPMCQGKINEGIALVLSSEEGSGLCPNSSVWVRYPRCSVRQLLQNGPFLSIGFEVFRISSLKHLK